MLKTYKVLVTPKFPSWSDRECVVEVYAKTAKDAISSARKEICRSGRDMHDGPLTYKIAKDEGVL